MNNFKDLGISNPLIEEMKKSGIKIPTEIQQQAIVLINEGVDIIAESQTGTGKTLAFLLPMFDSFIENSKNIQGLILAPTRELALQITNEAEKLTNAKKLNILAVYGGKDIKSQLNKLSGNVDIVIATPGRLLDHIKRESIDLNKVKTFVIDEVDQMLLMGFRNEIDEILKSLPKKRQTLCLSATINSEVKKLAYRITNDPSLIIIEKEEAVLTNIDQFVIKTTDRRKKDAICQIINENNPFLAIIFCRTKLRVDKLEEALYERGFNCQKLHSDIPQSKREKIMKAFKNLELQILVATDIAARGIDVTGVTHIYNYDIPENAETYIHRIGRTGRAGDKGQTYMFLDPKDENVLKEIELELAIKIQEKEIEHIEDVQAIDNLPKKKYNKRINAAPKKFDADDKRRK